MRAARSFVVFVVFALLGASLLAGPAQAGWRHGHGYGYGGCGYGGYGYGGYGYGGYGYGGYAGYRYGGYWSEPMAYSYSPSYSARTYSYRPTYGSQPYAAYGSRPAAGGQSYGSTPAAAARPTTVLDIGAYDNYFQQNNITVKPGTTVRWTNRGGHAHTITSNQNLWDSGDIQPGATYTATFTHPGTYYYYCRHHTGEEMRGVIVVQGEAAPVAGREPARAGAESARRPGGAAPANRTAPRY
jgi:plastocyanin